MFGMTRHCCLTIAHRQACKKQKLMHGASYVIPSYQEQKCRQALTEGWNERRQAHVFLSSHTFHSWNQSEPELDQKESDFPVWDQCCICSPSMRASNSDRVHLVNKAWWIWMWRAWVEIGRGGGRECPVCLASASCASLWAPLWLSEPVLVGWGGLMCVLPSTPTLITFNKNLFPSLLAPVLFLAAL